MAYTEQEIQLQLKLGADTAISGILKQDDLITYVGAQTYVDGIVSGSNGPTVQLPTPSPPAAKSTTFIGFQLPKLPWKSSAVYLLSVEQKKTCNSNDKQVFRTRRAGL
jgi:hypothetical protein